MKNDNLGTKLLRLGVFAVLLAGSAMAALMPDWATTLKAQSYSSYVDLQLGVQASAPVLSAGTNADLLVTITNAGPADANRTRTVTLLQGDAVASATSGCLEDPLGFPDCQLSTPLPAGASADYLMTFAISPLARDHLNVAVAAASDDIEAAPGQELVLLELPIEAHVDLSAVAACDRAYMPTSAPLSCQVVLRNAGPAAAIMPYLFVNPYGTTASNLICNAPRQELCPAQIPDAWMPGVMMPGEVVVLSFDLAIDPNVSFDPIYFESGAYQLWNEIDDMPLDNDNMLIIPVPLFRDDFEGDPPAAAP